MLRRLWALLAASRLRRRAYWALAGIALEQAEMLMFGRRTGHGMRASFPPLFVRA
jgi:hypothetical protein